MVDQPSFKEDEYFAKQEFDRKKKNECKRQALLATDERNRLEELHHMHCPKCGMELIEIDYLHILIDKCSGCDGIWLDAGELEELGSDEQGRFGRFLKLFEK